MDHTSAYPVFRPLEPHAYDRIARLKWGNV